MSTHHRMSERYSRRTVNPPGVYSYNRSEPRRLLETRHLLNLAVQACCVKICAVAYWLQQQTDFSTRPIKLVHIVQSTASLQ